MTKKKPAPSLLTRLTAYRKTLAAVIGAGLTWASATYGDEYGTWIALGIALATAAGVYAAPNEPLEDEGLTSLGLLLVVLLILVVFLPLGLYVTKWLLILGFVAWLLAAFGYDRS